jgi:alpha-L-arabinofuranosidase
MDEDVLFDVSLLDFDNFEVIECIEMSGYGIKDENSAIHTPVKPFNAPKPDFDGKTLTTNLKALSWNVIRLAKRK